MRQLFFNDLSCSPPAKDFQEAWNRVNQFIQTYKSRPDRLFERRICCEGYLGDMKLSDHLSISDFCRDPRGRTLGSLLLGISKHPYIDSGSEAEAQFIEADFFLLKDESEVTAYGLTAAFLNDSVAIGFASEPFWNGFKFTIRRKIADQETEDSVFCFASPERFQTPEFIKWCEARIEPELIETELTASDKKINLRDDHGKNVLEEFARRLVCSPYILEIVNSLPFNPKEKHFVKAVKNGGIVEIVLPWTDEGLGLVVRTTGRNMPETEKIARLLEERFRGNAK